jgi:tetratricopeptide (TPR) repeat protein
MTVGPAASPQAVLRSMPSPPPPNPPPVDTAAKEATVADLKEQTQSILSRVGDATNNFHEIDGLDSVEKLPAPVSESVVSLVDRAREHRLELGYETALREYGTEIQTADALSVVDQITRNIGYNNASEASSKVTDFLKNNPEPVADSQKPLWRYLTSVQTLCSRLEKEADVHLQRAQALAAEGKNSEAIQEYREANRIFPCPATAQKIRQLASSQNKPSKP